MGALETETSTQFLLHKLHDLQLPSGSSPTRWGAVITSTSWGQHGKVLPPSSGSTIRSRRREVGLWPTALQKG